MKIFLRPALASDVPVLQHWDRQPHVLQARNLHSPDTDWDWQAEIARSPSWRELLIGEVDGRPVAFIQLIDPLEEDTHYWGTVPANRRAIDIWIGEKEDTGKGYGTVMMQLALDRCFREPSIQNVLIDPLADNRGACRFYERLGFRFVEQRLFEEDRCLVYELSRPAWMEHAAKQPTVVCAGAVITRDGKFLLGRRSPSASWYPDVWDVFGGHAEAGETSCDTIVRELREELNIVATHYSLPDVLAYFEGSVQKKVLYHHFFVTAWQGEIQNHGEEHTEIRWFSRAELDTLPLAAKEYVQLIDAWMHLTGKHA